MRRLWVAAALAAVALSSEACRRYGDESEGRPERPRRRPHDPYLIDGEELREANAQNLYEAVRIRRPAWLTKTIRGASGDEAVVVYLDDRKLGLLPVLRSLRVDLAERLRYLSPNEAQLRYGPLHGALAAIVIEIPK